MSLKDIILSLFLIALVGIYIDLRRSGVLSFSQTNVSSDTVIVNLPPQTINFPAGQPINIINQAIPSKVDTGAILRAFFSEVTYLDSVDTDTLKIVLKEVISQNKIVSRELTHRLKIPITRITNVYHRPSMLLVGGSVTKTDQVSLQGNVGYLTKQDVFIFGSFDPSTRQWGVGAMVPIRRSRDAFSHPANR
jgi:hypothetical protein